MQIAYLLTGTNLGDRCGYLQSAMKLLEERSGRVVRSSAIFETAAWGKEDQPSFLNQAICLETRSDARALLNEILDVELSMGRVRDLKYGPRVIDIDILFYDSEIIEEPGLTVPHPFLHQRRFALVCMNDLAPEFVHPVFHRSIAQLLRECSDSLPVAKFKPYAP